MVVGQLEQPQLTAADESHLFQPSFTWIPILRRAVCGLFKRSTGLTIQPVHPDLIRMSGSGKLAIDR